MSVNIVLILETSLNYSQTNNSTQRCNIWYVTSTAILPQWDTSITLSMSNILQYIKQKPDKINYWHFNNDIVS